MKRQIQFESDADRKRIVDAYLLWYLIKTGAMIIVLAVVPLVVFEWANANREVIQAHMIKIDKTVEKVLSVRGGD